MTMENNNNNIRTTVVAEMIHDNDKAVVVFGSVFDVTTPFWIAFFRVVDLVEATTTTNDVWMRVSLKLLLLLHVSLLLQYLTF